MKIEVDSLRRVKREIKIVNQEVKVLKKRKPFLLFCILLCLFLGLASLGFFGTIGAYEVKERSDILKLFQNGRYLVLFQNNAEMRPTGGFIGSFAVIDFKDYKIEKIDFNTNIYKIDNAYASEFTVSPPEPLAKINDGKWTLHDANFAVSFPEAAKTIQWFYKEETGNTVDGVIALNASSVQKLLKLTGPIALEKYNTVISQDNFFEELASKIEKEYFYSSENIEENEPKTILKDMVPLLLAKLQSASKLELLKLVFSELQTKQILLQSENKQVQESIIASDWGGQVKETTGDYLYINNANITDTRLNKNWGGKTSLKIKESIDYKVSGQTNLVSNLTLTRSHTGSYTWPDGVNINWTRILVPKGSMLLSAEMNGKDVTSSITSGEESGKTYFALWINTAPQTSNVLKITYSLPEAIDAQNYHLIVQKQSGNLGDDLKITKGLNTLYEGILNTDKYIQ